MWGCCVVGVGIGICKFRCRSASKFLCDCRLFRYANCVVGIVIRFPATGTGGSTLLLLLTRLGAGVGVRPCTGAGVGVLGLGTGAGVRRLFGVRRLGTGAGAGVRRLGAGTGACPSTTSSSSSSVVLSDRRRFVVRLTILLHLSFKAFIAFVSVGPFRLFGSGKWFGIRRSVRISTSDFNLNWVSSCSAPFSPLSLSSSRFSSIMNLWQYDLLIHAA
jgi:hypothetical protein